MRRGLRDRGAVLLVQGPWAQAEAIIDVGEPEWSGLGRGHGYLSARELTVTVTSRRTPVPRRGRVLLPAEDGALVPTAIPGPLPPTCRSRRWADMRADAPVRSLVLWFPDWPVTALTRDASAACRWTRRCRSP